MDWLLSIADLNERIPLLLSGSVIIALTGIFAFYRKSRRQWLIQYRESVTLYRDLRALTAAAVGVGERVLELERRQRHLAERQDSVDIYDAANQPYEQAIRMVQRGAKVSELVDICGLSQGEAELISMLHRMKKAG